MLYLTYNELNKPFMTTSMHRMGIVASAFLLSVLGAAAYIETAHAASSGDLVKCSSGPSVYLLGDDGKRYAFPNEKVFFTWNEGFEKVKTITCDNLAKKPLGGLVPYQAGTRLVKIPSVNKVYVVTSGGVLRPIKDEAMAQKLFGDDWAKRVDDLSEAFFPRYTVAAELGENELPEGTVITAEDGSLLRVDESGEAVEIEDVIDEEKLNVLKRHAQISRHLENRMGLVIKKIRKLEREIDRLQELVDKLKAIQVDEDDKIDIEDIEEATEEEIAEDRETFQVDEREAKDAAEAEAKKIAEEEARKAAEKDEQDADESDADSQEKEIVLPDLRVLDLSLSSTNQIVATLTNDGAAVGTENVDVHVWLDEVLEWTYNATTLSAAQKMFLNAGGISDISPQQVMGARAVKVCVDYLDAVSESDDTNNCRTETLEAKDGDFAINNVATYMLDALGDPDQLTRTFSFESSGPLDHYRIRIWDSSGALHDELVQQVIGSSVTAFYVSPSWLTPMSENSQYQYEIHAEEYNTGDADSVTGWFNTGTNSVATSLLISLNNSISGAASFAPGMTELFTFSLYPGATGVATVLDVPFKLTTSDNNGGGWNTCSQMGDASNFALFFGSDYSTDAADSWTFYDSSWTACGSSNATELLVYAVAGVNNTFATGFGDMFIFAADTSGASAKLDDSIRISVDDYAHFTWNDGVSDRDGSTVAGMPIQGGTLIY